MKRPSKLGQSSLLGARFFLFSAGLMAQSGHAQTEPAAEVVEPVIESIVVSGKYIDSGAKSGMKMNVSARDTPFSVSSYSGAFMKAVETINVAELYSYMTGVTRTGSSGGDLSMRGFGTTGDDRNAILVDGLPGLAGRFGSPPTAAVDHIELVKGPASVLYGQAQPGGFVNIIPKRPQSEWAGTFDIKASAFQGSTRGMSHTLGYDTSIDLTGPITSDKQFLFRMVAEDSNRKLWRDTTYERTRYFSPSVTWNIGRATSATAQFEHRTATNAYDFALAAPNNDIYRVGPDTAHYQQAGDFRGEDSNALSLNLTHKFDKSLRWNFAARLVRHEDTAAGFDQVGFNVAGVAVDSVPCTAASPCLNMRARGQRNERKYDFYDTNIAWTGDTGFLGHKLLVGLNGGREIADFERLQFSRGIASCPTATTFNCLAQDINNPLNTLPPLSSLPLGNLSRMLTTWYSTGVYASDVMKLAEHWKATAGVRYAADRQYIVPNLRQPTTPQFKQTTETLPMAGLLFQPTREWTAYTSYATSFVPAPASAQDVNGQNPFKPESARQIEVGAKMDLADDTGSATIAFFKIDKKNALSSFSCAIGTCSQQLGASRSKGAELEFNLRPLPNLQLTAGYAYTDAQVSASTDPALLGAMLVNSPRNSAHIWSRYDFGGGWGAALGVNAVSLRAGTLPVTGNTTVLQLPGYGVVDIGMYYSTKSYDYTFKVNNVMNRHYIASAGFEAGPLFVTPGTPRNFQLSARAHF